MNKRPPHTLACSQPLLRPCVLEVAPERLDFGLLAARHAVERMLTVSNLSTHDPLKIRKITLAGRDANCFKIVSLGKNLIIGVREALQVRVRLISVYSDANRGDLRARITVFSDCNGSNCNHTVSLSGRAIEAHETIGFELESGALVWDGNEVPDTNVSIAQTAYWKISADTYEGQKDLEIKSLSPLEIEASGEAQLACALYDYLALNAEWNRNVAWPGGKLTDRKIEIAQYEGYSLQLRQMKGISTYEEVKHGRAQLISPQVTFSIEIGKIYQLFRSNFPFTVIPPHTTTALQKIFKNRRVSKEAQAQFWEDRKSLIKTHKEMKDHPDSDKWGAYKNNETLKGFFTYFSYYTTGLTPCEYAPKANYGLFIRSRWPVYAEFVLDEMTALGAKDAKQDLWLLAQRWWGDHKGLYGSHEPKGCTVLQFFHAILEDDNATLWDTVEKNTDNIVPHPFPSDMGAVVNRIHLEIRSLRNFAAPGHNKHILGRKPQNHSIIDSVLLCHWIFEWLREFSRRYARDEVNAVFAIGFSGLARVWEKHYQQLMLPPVPNHP